MHVMPSPYRRVRRGERLRRGRYWSAFMGGSALAHVIALAFMAATALSFFQDAVKPWPSAYQFMYVELARPHPNAHKGVRPGVLPAGGQARRAPAPPVKVKIHERPTGPRPKVKSAAAHIAPKAPAPDKTADKSEQAALTPSAPDKITIVRGAEETTVAVASLPGQDVVRLDNITTAAAPSPMTVGKTEAAARTYKDISTTSGLAPITPAFRQMTALPAAPIRTTEVPSTETGDLPLTLAQAEKGVMLPRVRPAGFKGMTTVGGAPAPAEDGQTMPRVKITEPAPGDTGEGVVEVKGVAAGKGIGSVFLSAGGKVIELLLRNGSFETSVTLEPGENVLTARATDSQGQGASDQVTVNYARPKDFSVRAVFSGGARFKLTHKWRARPSEDKNQPGAAPPDFDVHEDERGGQVSVDPVVPGIYTVGVEYDAGPGKASTAEFYVTLYGGDASKKKTRTIGPFELDGTGFLPAVRVLMPEGVFWEDDGWFSGTVDGGQYTVKYKEPEGIVWREED